MVCSRRRGLPHGLILKDEPGNLPPALHAILRDGEALGFTMASEPRTGALLAVLAASKPDGRILELGTGTGAGTSWLLAGMDNRSRLDSVDSDEQVLAVAKRHLGSDPRVTFHLLDGAEFIVRASPRSYDLVYADAWPGKFFHLGDALGLLADGGIYVVDDLLPQTNWPDGHAAKVDTLLRELDSRPGFTAVRLSWASGLMLVARSPVSHPPRSEASYLGRTV